jgi:hypothetical protein
MMSIPRIVAVSLVTTLAVLLFVMLFGRKDRPAQ